MKVALVDNMNNNFFALARYFRDLGVEADLFLIPGRTATHFDPQNDTWQYSQHAGWIKDFPISYHLRECLSRYSALRIRTTFEKYDRVIACGLAVGLLKYANVNVDLFIPYGSDLYNLPFFNQYFINGQSVNVKKISSAFLVSILQSRGIKAANHIICNTNWHTAQCALERLRVSAINLPRVMVYKETIPDFINTKYSWLEKHDFIVFSPTRHLWKTNADPMPDFKLNGGMKRNDKLIRSFARFQKLNAFRNPVLILCEYGSDIPYSKQLIEDLGITSNVVWLPLMPRKEIVAIMSRATFVADQFRESMSATSAGTTNEALAYGAPVITNTDGAIFKSNDPFYQAPILEALSEDDIFTHFAGYITNKEPYEIIRREGMEWFDKNLGIGLAERYLAVMCSEIR